MNNTNNKEILEISIEDIIPNRFQPRLTFDVEALNELANSIREHGIIQPLVVRRLQDKFEIIAGERRYKAATLVGMQKVPCIVMNLNDNESAEVAVIENIQRKEMTPLEEAKSFKKILDKGYLTQDELARKMGKSQSSIANKLRLLNLDETVQDAILNNKISERHARSILKISSKEVQRNILQEILEKRLTVKQTDDLINEKYGDNNMNNIQNNVENSIFKTQNNMADISFRENNSSESIESFDVTPETKTSSIFQYNLPSSNNLSLKENELNQIINPSVFNEDSKIDNFQKNQTSMLNVDVDSIKNNAQDIKKQEETLPLEKLLENNELEKKNKFFIDLNVPIKINKLDILNTKLNEIKELNIQKEIKDLGTHYEIILKLEK